MAKLLIVEDYTKTIKKIANQLQKINSSFQTDNVFCFIPFENSKLAIHTIDNLDTIPNLTRIDFSEKKEAVFSAVQDFLKRNTDDHVLVLIDVLLISPNPNAPSRDQYQLSKEYSCELYAELIKIKNGKHKDVGINGDDLSFIIYSRSDSILTVVAPTLQALYTDNESQFFPRECCLPRNISWCKNREEVVETDTEDDEQLPPLALPIPYIEYLRTL